MNNKYYLVSDILNEGIGSFITKKVPYAIGKGIGKSSRIFGMTPEKLHAGNKKNAEFWSKLLRRNISYSPKNQIQRGIEQGVKPRKLTTKGRL